jgi:hypothetical protein
MAMRIGGSGTNGERGVPLFYPGPRWRPWRKKTGGRRVGRASRRDFRVSG